MSISAFFGSRDFNLIGVERTEWDSYYLALNNSEGSMFNVIFYHLGKMDADKVLRLSKKMLGWNPHSFGEVMRFHKKANELTIEERKEKL